MKGGIEGVRESERVHNPGERCVLELRAYLQADGTVQVRWLSNGVSARTTGTDSALLARAYELIAKDAISGAVIWARLDGKEGRSNPPADFVPVQTVCIECRTPVDPKVAWHGTAGLHCDDCHQAGRRASYIVTYNDHRGMRFTSPVLKGQDALEAFEAQVRSANGRVMDVDRLPSRPPLPVQPEGTTPSG